MNSSSAWLIGQRRSFSLCSNSIGTVMSRTHWTGLIDVYASTSSMCDGPCSTRKMDPMSLDHSSLSMLLTARSLQMARKRSP
jgi:hypothetical protein